MRATTSATLTERIAALLRAGDYESLSALYRPDAVLDVNVPQWRYQLQGPEAILRLFREEELSREGWRVATWRCTTTDDGLVAETEVHFREEGEERMWRDVHLVHTDGEKIADHVVYCTGIWDAATIARQAVEAPMVRP